MQTRAIQPAGLLYRDGESVPYSDTYQDVYHARAGALEQARHVFLRGNSLPQRWASQQRFVILETGFGLGNNFLATWQAWREDPRRCERLYFLSIEKHPLVRENLRRAQANSPLRDLADQLVACWPPLTPNVHVLEFEQGRVQLMLALGDARELLGQWVARVDAFYLDGFAPARNPEMWEAHGFKRMARLAAPGATLATWSTARSVRDGLQAAGFSVTRATGFADKREMSVARFEPRHMAPSPPGGWHDGLSVRRALIVGAGLAGCASAQALSQEGWQVTVLDAQTAPAQAASGNPAGLFHGIVHAQDGAYARVHRAAALHAANRLQPDIQASRLVGACDGLLRLDTDWTDEEARACLQRQGLPADYARWLDVEQARRVSGLALPGGGWLFERAGWVDPRAYARSMLDGSGAQWRGSVKVARIERVAGHWLAVDQHGHELASAPVLVLANAADMQRLLAPHTARPGRGNTRLDNMRLHAVRGQLSWLKAGAPGVRLPRLAVAGAGYVLRTLDDQLVCGATAHAGDFDDAVRLDDHGHNLSQAAALGAVAPPDLTALASLAQGRVAWRAVSADRLPLIGALPAFSEPPQTTRREDQPRWVSRERDDQGGLYVYAGLGSRGIAWAALGAQVLASWITGRPCPLEADLRDALDPARFVAREQRKQPSSPRE